MLEGIFVDPERRFVLLQWRWKVDPMIYRFAASPTQSIYDYCTGGNILSYDERLDERLSLLNRELAMQIERQGGPMTLEARIVSVADTTKTPNWAPYRPANLIELLSFGWLFPELPVQHELAAVGTSYYFGHADGFPAFRRMRLGRSLIITWCRVMTIQPQLIVKPI